MRAWALMLVLMMTACAGPLQQAGANTATGALNAADTPAAKKEEADVTANAATAGTQAAVNDALSPTNQALYNQVTTGLITNAGTAARAQTALLMTDLRSRVTLLERASLDEAFSPETIAEVNALVDNARERAFGQPLRDDTDAWVADAAPKFGTAMGTAFRNAAGQITPTLDAEAAKWKPIAIGFGAGAGALLLTVVVLMWTLRGHRKVIEKLASQRAV